MVLWGLSKINRGLINNKSDLIFIICILINRCEILYWIILHIFSFKTPTLWALMSEGNCFHCAFEMRNGVKVDI